MILAIIVGLISRSWWMVAALSLLAPPINVGIRMFRGEPVDYGAVVIESYLLCVAIAAAVYGVKLIVRPRSQPIDNA